MPDFGPFFSFFIYFRPPRGAPSPEGEGAPKVLVALATILKTFCFPCFLDRVAWSSFASRAFLLLTLAPSTSFFEVFGGGMVMFSAPITRWPTFRDSPTENKLRHEIATPTNTNERRQLCGRTILVNRSCLHSVYTHTSVDEPQDFQEGTEGAPPAGQETP